MLNYAYCPSGFFYSRNHIGFFWFRSSSSGFFFAPFILFTCNNLNVIHGFIVLKDTRAKRRSVLFTITMVSDQRTNRRPAPANISESTQSPPCHPRRSASVKATLVHLFSVHLAKIMMGVNGRILLGLSAIETSNIESLMDGSLHSRIDSTPR